MIEVASRSQARRVKAQAPVGTAVRMRRSDVGNGNDCPLFPDHGRMLVIPQSDPPRQYCPHIMHDGEPKRDSEHRPPRSRAFWPLHGFEESVATYFARLDKAVSVAGLPDLSDLEVK